MVKAGPIKLGIVGLGRAGAGMHCPELDSRKDMFQIVAVCDVIEERRNKMAEKYGCSAYQTIEELVADPEVEMVAIATRSVDHFIHGKIALEAGKDVFMEKPMCRTYDEALKLKEIAEKYGITESRFGNGKEDCILCGLCVRVCKEIIGKEKNSTDNFL